MELQQILIDTTIFLKEETQASGAAVIRKAMDEAFVNIGDWQEKKNGGVDWMKRAIYNKGIISRIGVEIQVSARSDQLIRDIVHLRNSL